jgi:DNA-binding response OmpR family regulator
VHNEEVRVVVVEDDPDASETLKELLEINGYTVHTAADAARAMALIQVVRPTCVLLDLGLPETADGLAVATWLQARFGPTVIVVVVTGSNTLEDLEAAHQAGADYVLSKPIDIDRLNAILMPMR